MPPSPLNPLLGGFRVRGQNARKAPSPPLTLLRVRGQGASMRRVLTVKLSTGKSKIKDN